jgi:LAS superfamily LD-carboxypeptidase LdcB
MQGSFKKIFIKIILGIILVGLVVFGLIKYIDLKFSKLETEVAQIEEKNNQLEIKNQEDIKKISDLLFGTQDNLLSVLEQEKIKNSSLANQFAEITNTVGALEKLSTTDPELLKKYSKVYFLSEHYVPVALSDIPVGYRYEKSSNYQIHADVLSFLEKMIDAGNADSVSIRTLSAYRSFATQTALKDNYTATYGAGANKFSADQGYSEHQLGTAIDFTTVKTNGLLNGFDKTPEYKWMKENAYKYGFVISYPYGNSYYRFEPWHWRFVGVELATKLHELNKNFYDADQRFIDNYLIKLFDPINTSSSSSVIAPEEVKVEAN